MCPINWLSVPINLESTQLLHLRLLGGLALEVKGEVCRGRAAQKRRLALLALLATAPHRSVSRDKVMGLLWPDRDEEQARHLLSAGVYEIRKELGEAVLVTHGDHLVLDGSAITTDLDRFLAAMNEGNPEDAVALYAGPFLDGVFVSGSPCFDHWVEETRESIRHTYRRALETTAEAYEARGDPHAAVGVWRRLAADDRYDCRVALRLLQALVAAGHHAGAIQFARVHQALLREEFDVEPTPEFAAAAAAIGEAARALPVEATGLAPAGPPAAWESGEQGDSLAPSVAVVATVTAAEPAIPTQRLVVATPDPWALPPGPGEAGSPSGGTRLMAPLATIAVLMAGAITAGALIQVRTARAGAGPTTIAVLPFEHGDGVDEAFAHGLTEEVLGVLAAVPGVRIPVWSAAVSMRGVDARTAATTLGVDHVLEGTVRRDADRLRVRVWLSDAHGMQVWTERYDRFEGPAFQAQDDIARAVLSALEVKLDIARDVLHALDLDVNPDAVRPLDGATADPLAFSHYVRGRHSWYLRTPDGFAQALRYFQNAVAQDEQYARAYAGLADTYNLLGAHIYGLMPPDSAFPRAREAAERALALAPGLAQGHLALAQTLASYDRDWAGAEAAFREAIRLDPNYAETHHWYSLLLVTTGRPDEALATGRVAVRLDSISPHTHANMGRLLYYLGDYQEAEESFKRALALDVGTVPAQFGLGLAFLEMGRPEDAARLFARITEAAGKPNPVGLALLGHALARAGRIDEARATLIRLRELEDAGTYVPPEYPAIVHLALSDLDRALDGVEHAFRARSSAIAFMMVDPLTEPLREHPRFQHLASEAGLR